MHRSSLLKHAIILLAVLSAAYFAPENPPALSRAATTQPTTRQARIKDNRAHDALLADLTSGDQTRITAALAQIKKEAHKHIKQAEYLRVIVEAKRRPDAEAAAQDLIAAQPGATLSVDGLQRFLTDTLLADQKTDQALSAAKVYYNVCLLKNTSDAIDLVALCLARARPHDMTAVHQFKLEQIAGAATQPAGDPAHQSQTQLETQAPGQSPGTQATSSQTLADLQGSVLDTIPIDPKPYEEAIANINPLNYRDFAAKGNLLLLAGRAKEARELLEQAVDLAPEKETAAAIENVARALRAEHGCVGPANAYILKLRVQQQ